MAAIGQSRHTWFYPPAPRPNTIAQLIFAKPIELGYFDTKYI
jgi:hypothetical protein